MDRTGRRRRGRPRSGVRVAVAAVGGLLTFGVAVTSTPWQIAITLSWVIAASIWLVWVWLSVRGSDGDRTAAIATAEDPSRAVADGILVVSSGASLVGIALALLEAGAERGTTKDLTTAIAGICLVVSWTTVNTVFTLRYARLYYGDVPGGVNFHDEQGDPPTFGDFAYLSFTIGMTYQVSDTDLTARAIRRTALLHALLSFVFVTSVVAMTINIVAQLILP